MPAMSFMQIELTPICFSSLTISTNFAVVCTGLVVYEMVPEAIAPYLKDHDVLLLQNHGALTVGCDLITAYYRMETLELFAKISLTAHLLGGAQEIPRPQIDKLLDLRENYYHVTGRHPGYKKYSQEE